MTPSSSDPAGTVETLLAEGEWVRRLARSLVADPATADDAVQDTWLAAVSTPRGPVARGALPRDGPPPLLRRRAAARSGSPHGRPRRDGAHAHTQGAGAPARRPRPEGPRSSPRARGGARSARRGGAPALRRAGGS